MSGANFGRRAGRSAAQFAPSGLSGDHAAAVCLTQSVG